ncbi:MAG TPA: Lrp/AsnC family transcriptional regulator [Anaerolineaceae bacterium]|nr:Lrp/AsnC family transcriptional regulator [Anaerolineaceae bacterium]
MPALDCTDQKIITVLSQDARATTSRIARETGIPERTIHHRIKRLKEEKLIRTVAVVNPEAFGYTLAVDMFCELEIGSMPQAIAALMELPEISYMAISTGDQDISLQALFKSSEELQEFITQKLHQVPGMRRTRTALIPRILKDTYQWIPPDPCGGNGQKLATEST